MQGLQKICFAIQCTAIKLEEVFLGEVEKRLFIEVLLRHMNVDTRYCRFLTNWYERCNIQKSSDYIILKYGCHAVFKNLKTLSSNL